MVILIYLIYFLANFSYSVDSNKLWSESLRITLKGHLFVLGETLEILLKVVKLNHSIDI